MMRICLPRTKHSRCGQTRSGSSQNVIEAVTTGREKGLLTVAFTGEGGGKMAALPHYILDVPSTSTPRIQEAHLFLLHLLAQELEERLS